MAFHRPNNCEKNRKLVLRMSASGASLTAIAAAVKTNRRHVKTFLKKHGAMRHFPYCLAGDKHYNWKGGRLVDKNGYVLVYCPGHPMARGPSRRYVLEHRLVMSNHLGRLLRDGEVVHHKNDDLQDNRLENLELFENNAAHLRGTISGQVPLWTEAGIRRMKEGIARSAAIRSPKTRIRSARDVLWLR